MSTVEMIIQFIGFDPTRLTGRPTGYTMFYLQGMSLAAIISFSLIAATPLQRAAKVQALCLSGMLVGLVWVTIVQHQLFVEYPGKTTIATDTGIAETFIIPIPMPGLRSKSFDAWSVGSPNYRNAQPSAFDEEIQKPENTVGTYTTIAVHWLGLIVFLVGLFTSSGLGLKVLIAKLRMRFRP